jgi:hypothetical protein
VRGITIAPTKMPCPKAQLSCISLSNELWL